MRDVIFSLLLLLPSSYFFFFFNDTATTEIYTLSLHDALPISARLQGHQEIPRPHPRRRGEDEGRRGGPHRSGADRRPAERAVRVRVRIPRRQYGVGRR